MWIEDPTRSRGVNTLQFDVDLPAAGAPSLAILDPFLLPGTRHANAAGDPLIDGGGDLGPFDLYEIIEDPVGSIDVRVVLQSSDWFDLETLAGQWSAFPICTGAACVPQQLGLARDRLHLGSFYMSLPNGELGDGPPVFVGVPPSSLYGYEYFENTIDALVVDLRNQLRASAGMLRIEGLAPEPASAVLLTLALAAVGCIRGRCFA